MVPYMWRRHLGIMRAILALLCVATYVMYPVRYGVLIASIAALYAAYSILTLLRDTVESNLYPVSMLLLDGVFFLLCALHPSKQGLWLSTVSVLLCARFFGAAIRVVARLRSSIGFRLLLRGLPAHAVHVALAGGGARGRSRRRACAS